MTINTLLLLQTHIAITEFLENSREFLPTPCANIRLPFSFPSGSESATKIFIRIHHRGSIYKITTSGDLYKVPIKVNYYLIQSC
jgi:hypothetical protein